MNIQQEDNKKYGAFYIEKDGNRVAELAYSWKGDKLISLDHTEVDDSLEGKGVGSTLVEFAVNFAIESGIKIVLHCPFAKKVFEKHREYKDVLQDSY